MLPFSEMATLVAVADSGSLSAAARQLGLSKAAVSEQMRRLELQLGTRLLNRTTRRLSLTEAGEACYRHGRRMVAEAEAAARAATRLQEAPRGVLRVTAPTTFAPMHIVPALPAFRERHPQITIDLSLSAAAADLVRERFDLAIRIGELPDSRLTARRLVSYRLVVCAAPEYLRRRGEPRQQAELAEHEALEFAPLGWRGQWHLVDPRGRAGRVPISPVLVSDAGEVLLQAAIDGLGLALLPNWMVAPALRAGRLVRVMPGWGGRPTPVFAVFVGGPGLAPKVRLFVDHIARHLASADWSV